MTDNRYVVSYCYGTAGHLIANLILAFNDNDEALSLYQGQELPKFEINPYDEYSPYIKWIRNLEDVNQSKRYIVATHLNNATDLELTGRTVISIGFNVKNVNILRELHMKKYNVPLTIEVKDIFEWYHTFVPSENLLQFEWVFQDHELLLTTMSKILKLPVNEQAAELLEKYSKTNLEKYKILNKLIDNTKRMSDENINC